MKPALIRFAELASQPVTKMSTEEKAAVLGIPRASHKPSRASSAFINSCLPDPVTVSAWAKDFTIERAV